MANRLLIVLAAGITALSFTAAAVHAGVGGIPSAPGAGKSTDYCCQTWQRAEGRGEKATTFVSGTACKAIAEDDFSRNACVGTVVKCRGEFYTPSGEQGGTVQRCLTP